MSYNFSNISRAVIAAADKKPGHSDVLYMVQHSKVTTFASALNDDTPGSTKRIITDHTIAGGVLVFQLKPKSVKPTGDSQGEAGGQVRNFKYEVTIKGDSPIIEEFFDQGINEDWVAFFNDPICDQVKLLQVGGKCSPANISGYSYKGGSRGEGGVKEHTFSIESTDRYWYEGTLTEKENSELADPTIVSFSAVTDTTLSVSWPAVTNAESYTVQRSTSADFSSPTSNTVTAPTVTLAVTGLTAATLYYFRVKANATGYTSSGYTKGAITTDA
jgi:hypothetical protein